MTTLLPLVILMAQKLAPTAYRPPTPTPAVAGAPMRAADAPAATPAPSWTLEPDAYRGVPFGSAEAVAAEKLKIRCQTPGRSLPGIDRTCFGPFSIANATDMSNMLMYRQDQLVSVYLGFKSKDYASVKAVILEKYGPPTAAGETPIKTLMGAEYINEKCFWNGKKIRLELTRYAGNVNDSSAVFSVRDFYETMSEESKKRAKADAEKF